MAYINQYHVFVIDEQVTRGVRISEHPVEKGLDLTDNIKREPITISITGEIVGKNAAKDLNALTNLHHQGTLVKYQGRNIMNNAVIEQFNTSHPIDIYGGCSFDMTLREIRVAKPAYVSSTSNKKSTKATKSGTQQVQKNTIKTSHLVKKGDTLWGLAKSYYGDGSLFFKIYVQNRKIIGNDPNKIKVGMVLQIPI